jgi:hypothetical protein
MFSSETRGVEMIEKLLRLCIVVALLMVVTVVMSACLSASVTPSYTDTPLPPQPSRTIPSTPEWREYESALAKAGLPEDVSGMCEWEILGQQAQELYVWAYCSNGSMAMSAPAIIYLGTDGAVRDVRFRDGTLGAQDSKVLFPLEIQEKIFTYQRNPDLKTHIRRRLADPSIAPLIIIFGTPLPVLPTASTDDPAAELRQPAPTLSRPTKTPTPIADSTLLQQALPRYGERFSPVAVSPHERALLLWGKTGYALLDLQSEAHFLLTLPPEAQILDWRQS